MRALILCLALAGALACLGQAAAEGPKAADRAAPARDAHDLVFLGDSRPVLVRLHVQVDGKPLQASYDAFIDHVFKYLDTNGDGVLSKEEAERLPPPQVLFSPNGIFNAPALPPGTPRDGKMSREELADYFRKNGAPPFQVRYLGGNANFNGQVVFVAGGLGASAPAGADQLNEALFNLLDTNKDGKLSKEELAAAPAVLGKLDQDEDEMITTDELLGNSNPSSAGIAGFVVAQPGAPVPQGSGPFLALGPGESPAKLARELLTRYGKGKKTLSRADLGLDKDTFAALDADGDGTLDSEELAHFADRPADLEAAVRFGQREQGEAPLALQNPGGRPAPLAAASRQGGDGTVVLDMGATRLEVRLAGGAAQGRVAGLRDLYVTQFKAADTDNNGYLDMNEANRSPLFRNTFKLMDRDGDGKLFEKEMLEYVDAMLDLQVRAQAACASLSISDEGKGLFDLIDTNRDGRLSVRELRQAARLVAQLDRDGDGAVSRGEIPRSYQLSVARGASVVDPGGARRVVVATAGNVVNGRPAPQPTAGPLWFRKMDRNRDGDVSRKEFLGTDEEFRRIDADGDGLISADEATRYDEQLRKEKGGER
jgi:Ca2+-binding EF-hand superfamily protein